MFMMKMKPLYRNGGLFTAGCVINGSMLYWMIQDNIRCTQNVSKIEENGPFAETDRQIVSERRHPTKS